MSTDTTTDALPEVDNERLERLHARLVTKAAATGDLDVAYRTVDSPLGPLVLAATPLATIAVTTFLVNFRHVFYALSFPLHVVRGPQRRTYAMYALTDETYAVVATRAPGALTGARVLWIQVLCQAYWVGGGILGALAGSLLPDVPGLDFALTALFAVLAIDAFRATRDVPAPLLAVGCAIVAQLVAPGQMLVVAMTGFVALLVGRYALTEARDA